MAAGPKSTYNPPIVALIAVIPPNGINSTDIVLSGRSEQHGVMNSCPLASSSLSASRLVISVHRK